MTGEWLSLGEGEAVVWEGRPKTTAALPGIGTGVALLVGAVWLVSTGNRSLVAVLLATAGIVTAVSAYLRVVNIEYVITDRTVYSKQGVLGIRITESALSKIQNSAFSQDALGSLFGYGSVSLEVAGGDDLRLRRIENPERVRRLVDRATTADVPGSLDQWHAVLDEVRALRRAVDAGTP